jgi:hypothetical protein
MFLSSFFFGVALLMQSTSAVLVFFITFITQQAQQQQLTSEPYLIFLQQESFSFSQSFSFSAETSFSMSFSTEFEGASEQLIIWEIPAPGSSFAPITAGTGDSIIFQYLPFHTVSLYYWSVSLDSDF